MKKKTGEKPNGAIKLDLGCGKNKQEGFLGVDVRKFEGVDVVFDLAGKKRWPWKDNSVEEIRASHFIEHLDPEERIRFVNEVFRILKPGGKALIITPHWCSTRAYGDLTHKWPPVSEFWFFYLSEEWRKVNAPHNDGYKCNFEAQWGYTLSAALQVKSEEQRQYALQNLKEAASDTICTLTKPVPKKKET